MRKAISVEVFIGLALGLILFAIFTAILPGPAETIKNSLQSLFGTNKQISQEVNQQLTVSSDENVVWVISDYYLPYSSDALAKLSYELAYDLGLIDYQRYTSLASKLPVLQKRANNICCEFDKGKCKILISSTREFCNAFGGKVHEFSCDIYIKLTISRAKNAYILLDSPTPIKCGYDYYFIPCEYADIANCEENTCVKESLFDTIQILKTTPVYYCLVPDAPGEVKNVISAVNYYTIYRVATLSTGVQCYNNLPLQC